MRMRKILDLGTLCHCLSLEEKLYWRGGSASHSVAGVGGGEVDTTCMDCPLEKNWQRKEGVRRTGI